MRNQQARKTIIVKEHARRIYMCSGNHASVGAWLYHTHNVIGHDLPVSVVAVEARLREGVVIQNARRLPSELEFAIVALCALFVVLEISLDRRAFQRGAACCDELVDGLATAMTHSEYWNLRYGKREWLENRSSRNTALAIATRALWPTGV